MNKLLFLTLILVLVLAIFASNYLLISDTLYFNTFAEQLTYEQIETLITQSKKWEWLGYVLVPVLISAKIALVATCLSIGLYFVTNNFRFKTHFGVALVAEFVFLVPSVLKIGLLLGRKGFRITKYRCIAAGQ